MFTFKRPLAAAAVFALALGMSAFGQKKDAEDKDEKNDQSLEMKACGPDSKEVYYVADTDKSKHPVPDQVTDKAVIVVLRPTLMGNKIQTKLAVDAEWKGVNRGKNYFFFNLEPGEHYFCSQAENRSLLSLKVEAGKTYFLQQHIKMGLVKARNKLEVMTEEEGKKKLAECHPSTWELKK